MAAYHHSASADMGNHFPRKDKWDGVALRRAGEYKQYRNTRRNHPTRSARHKRILPEHKKKYTRKKRGMSSIKRKNVIEVNQLGKMQFHRKVIQRRSIV